MRSPTLRARAFTLIELLVVVAIIGILVGLLFPAFKAVQNQARSTQAKNDLTQIINAVNAFYTDYGKYPLVTADTIISATTASPNNNSDLFYTLHACPATLSTGVISWSLLNDQAGATTAGAGDKSQVPFADDGITWQ